MRSQVKIQRGVDPSEYDLDNIDNIDINFKNSDSQSSHNTNISRSGSDSVSISKK